MKHTELLACNPQLRHHSDIRIFLDLKGGVNTNYGEFGDFLDSVKAVTYGGSDD
jgi:hypothetical protein